MDQIDENGNKSTNITKLKKLTKLKKSIKISLKKCTEKPNYEFDKIKKNENKIVKSIESTNSTEISHPKE